MGQGAGHGGHLAGERAGDAGRVERRQEAVGFRGAPQEDFRGRSTDQIDVDKLDGDGPWGGVGRSIQNQHSDARGSQIARDDQSEILLRRNIVALMNIFGDILRPDPDEIVARARLAQMDCFDIVPII